MRFILPIFPIPGNRYPSMVFLNRVGKRLVSFPNVGIVHSQQMQLSFLGAE